MKKTARRTMTTDALERATDAFLIASAIIGYIALLFVQQSVGLFAGWLLPFFAWILALLLIALPFLDPALRRVLARDFELPKTVTRWAPAVQVIPLFCVEVDPFGLFALSVVALLAGNLTLRRKSDTPAAWSLGAGPLMCLIGLTVVPATEWLVLVPASIVFSGIALALTQVRRSRRARKRVARWSFMRSTDETTAQPATAVVMLGLPWALATLVTIPLTYVLIVSIPVPLSSMRSATAGAGRDPALARRDETSEDAAARHAFNQVFPSGLSYQGAVARLRHETVMIVSPPDGVDADDFHAAGPYYMRGLVQDHFNEAGANFTGGPQLDEYSDDDGDGWSELANGSNTAPIELEIYQQPLITRQGEWSILFSHQPALAVRAPRVLFHPDGVLVATSASEEWVRYAVRTGQGLARRLNLEGRKASHPDPQMLQLPRGEDLDWVAGRASDIVGGARTDDEIVNRIVSHFQEHYAYSTHSTDVPGLAGVVDFMKNRKGHCTYYAASSTLLLRSLGIPARVATGFLADRWSDDLHAFEVTTRNGHAWFEVHYEDIGWVTYDATPSERRQRALDALDSTLETGVSTWLHDVGADLRLWASSGGGEADLRLFAGTLLDGPRALMHSMRNAPVAMLGVFGVGIAAWFLLVQRRSRKTAERIEGRPKRKRSEIEKLYAKLLDVLAGKGFKKRTSQTPREFANVVADQELIAVTETIYRCRYGAHAATPADLDRMRKLLDRVATA